MFYRARFDGTVGAVLKTAYGSTEKSLEFWPVGRTSEGIAKGKANKANPHEAAVLEIMEVAHERLQAGQIGKPDIQFLAACALNCVENKLRPSIRDHVNRIAATGKVY